MDARELRIGNYLQGTKFSIARLGIESDGIYQITGMGIHMIESGKLAYEPIPISKDILIKAGAIQVKPRRGIQKAFKIYGVRINMSNSGNFYHKSRVYNSFHLLQNLIYALTGKELVI